MSFSDIPAFRMFGNLYFVGCKKVSVHIIKTEAGLVMIDTGYPDMFEIITEGMKELMFDPKNIIAIFHSHGHIDHFGCTLRLKALSGAKTYIGAPDNDIVNGKDNLSWTEELGLEDFEKFNCDVLIRDGDKFTFGKTTVRCLHTPGHTAGVMSYFVNVEENGESLIAGMFGGAGMNSLSADWLNKKGLSFDLRDKFRASLNKARREKVDIVMGNHTSHNETAKKRETILSGGRIADKEEWGRMLQMFEKRLDDMLLKESE